MPLLLRRGTNAERLLITPQEGELIYVTDTQQLFVGDGITLGGNTISSSLLGGTLTNDLNLGGYEINGVGNVAIVGSISASIGYTGNVYGNSGETLVDSINGVLLGALSGSVLGSLQGSVISDDSSLIIDGATRAGYFSSISGDLSGSVFADDSTVVIDGGTKNAFFNNIFSTSLTGSIFSNVFGVMIDATNKNGYFHSIIGDLTGSVFADNSSVIVDSVDGNGFFNDISINNNLNFIGSSLKLYNQGLDLAVKADAPTTVSRITVDSNDERSVLALRRSSDSDLTTSINDHGAIFFERTNLVGSESVTGLITSGNTYLCLASDSTSMFAENKFLTIAEGLIGIGTFTPTAKLDVRGTVKISNVLNLAPLSSAPLSPVAGDIAMADRTTWDPLSKGSGPCYPVYYTGTAWAALA
jgi:hypothetical protein